jgi:cytochrome c-type biogenesis protein CcmH
MMRRASVLPRILAVALLILSGAAPALSVQPDEMLSDRALESRARALSRELRCMVCQNQSIDDSDAPLARDLRVLVRERLQAGDSDGKVIEFLTARYGDFVLLKPRLAWHTALLWFAPPALLIVGAIALFLVARRRGDAVATATADGGTATLTPAEQARLAELTRARE